VRRYAAQVLLVIEREGREALIPAVDPIVEVDDAMEGPVVADPPEGLLDA
jgi:ribosomal 30S subunit maturation factor RimM